MNELESLRRKFPALQRRRGDGRPCIFFDAPGGTQVPQQVISAMEEYLSHSNANTHGRFITSKETDKTVDRARAALAAFLGAPRAESIIFGANMTTLTFQLSRAIGRQLSPGDEIIITRLDHDANISPWLLLQEHGIRIKWIDFAPDDCTLRNDQIAEQISPRTKLIAVGYASNAVGTINDIERIIDIARPRGIWTFVDAVHYAPHGLIDVAQLGCDFLACSVYKFFGPHIGAAYIRPQIAEMLVPDKVRPQEAQYPYKFETGTLNHEALAGAAAAIDYIAELGAAVPAEGHAPSLRERLISGMAHIHRLEQALARRMLSGLLELRGARLYGIQSLDRLPQRTPTFAITVANQHSAAVARKLADQGIFVWDGDFYAVEVVRRLGLESTGGFVRIGLIHYNTVEEVDIFLRALQAIIGQE